MKGSIITFGIVSLSLVSPARPQTVTVDIDDPARNPYQQTVTALVNTGDCNAGQCIVSFRGVEAGRRLLLTYASVRFDGDTNLGTGTVNAYISDGFPNGTTTVRVQIPGLEIIGKPPHYQAAGSLNLYIGTDLGPIMTIEGASGPGNVVATVVGYTIATSVRGQIIGSGNDQ